MVKKKKLTLKQKLEKAKLKWEKSPFSKVAKFAEKIKPHEWTDLAINIGLAYAGYDATKSWQGALLGPVSLKLAQAPGGTPPISQITGVAGLVMLGIAISVPGQWFGGLTAEEFRRELDRELENLVTGQVVYSSPDVKGKCAEGYIKVCRGDQSICIEPWREYGYKRWGWRRC